jgi:two-component system, chemotaxis family, response regulator Rcp1
MGAEVLLVEDNAGDVRLAQEALKGGRGLARLTVVRDGEEALAFLRRQGPHAAAPRPDLILLDLNLPRRGGREVLAAVKADEQLRRIPVIVFTSSEAERDVRDCYGLGANCYVSKPADVNDFLRVVRALEEFWLSVAKLPRGD